MRAISLLVTMGLFACQSDADKSDDLKEEGDSGLEESDSGTDDTESIPIEECPDNVICHNSYPLVLTGDTSNSSSRIYDGYGCAPSTNESGPESVYRLTLSEPGFLALALSDMAQDVDIDIHLLSESDPDACIDRGHWRAGSYLEAGDYWVIADSWVNSSGEEKSGQFTLRVGFTTLNDMIGEGMESLFADDVLFAYGTAWARDEGEHFMAAFTDFSLHSAEERLWLWDMEEGASLGRFHVAHGENSSASNDDAYAAYFSNINNSHQSSLGVMRGGETYTGSYGYSMRIDGLEPGYNDLVRSRAIVMHPWEGSRPEYIEYFGMTAPTWGCPGIDDRDSEYVIDLLADGGLMVFWYPDNDWAENSSYLP